MNEKFDPHSDSDLLNVRDEILGAINQFLYLFLFSIYGAGVLMRI